MACIRFSVSKKSFRLAWSRNTPSAQPVSVRFAPGNRGLPRNRLASSATGGTSPVSPSWVSRAHPSLPSRRIYPFIDSVFSGRSVWSDLAGSKEPHCGRGREVPCFGVEAAVHEPLSKDGYPCSPAKASRSRLREVKNSSLFLLTSAYVSDIFVTSQVRNI